MRFVILLLGAIFLSACTISDEPSTREELERAFERYFGFPPPAEVVEIKYYSRYDRGLMDGGQNSWMKFTGTPSLIEKITKSIPFRKEHKNRTWSGPAPDWYIAPEKNYYFIRTHDDTPEDESFCFEEVLWIDSNSGYAYHRKSYWD